tara:strand:- start:68 stop:442 length:375 start_codon:yes stop_codon:yes gene_type:complete
MDKRLYFDVSAKIVVEADDSFDLDNLRSEITVLNKGNTKDFEVTNCLVEYATDADQIGYYNLKNDLSDVGEATENKYSGLTKEDATKIKKDLEKLLELFGVVGQTPAWVRHKVNKIVKILKEVE